MGRYAQPTSLADALALRASGRYTPLAGGTDFYPSRVGKAIDEDVLDLSRLQNWRDIRETRDAFVIGAGVTWTQLIEARLPPLFDGLKLAAREVGGVQVQNRGTLVGNVCNASPAADGVPALLALEAGVWWNDAHGAHETPLTAFLTGPRTTILSDTGLVTGLRIPKPFHEVRSHFLKTGARTYLLISTVMIAANVEHADGVVVNARVAVGAASPVARRLEALEHALRGKPLTPALGESVSMGHLAPLSPIDDVRSDSNYRLEAALTLARRTLNWIGGAEC
jgi:CO/xanthine dehydrogenase FAD-binding subunit